MNRESLKVLRIFSCLLCTGLAAGATAPGLAAQALVSPSGPVSIQLDPARTEIKFSAGHLRRIHGTFRLKGGLFAMDSKTGVAQGEVLVDADSEKSNDAKLDHKIRTQTLESSTYPGIFFHPEKVTGGLPANHAEEHFKLTGSFTIHGRDHPLTVDIDATRIGTDYLFKTTFTVPYVKWGMKDASSFFMRDKNLRITVESHGTVEASHPRT